MNHDEPTYANQLWHARRLLRDQGREALDNPHGMIGRTCGCGSCFCCAARQVVNESYRNVRALRELKTAYQSLPNEKRINFRRELQAAASGNRN